MEEAYTSEHWLVRIYKVKDLENREKVAKPTIPAQKWKKRTSKKVWFPVHLLLISNTLLSCSILDDVFNLYFVNLHSRLFCKTALFFFFRHQERGLAALKINQKLWKAKENLARSKTSFVHSKSCLSLVYISKGSWDHLNMGEFFGFVC